MNKNFKDAGINEELVKGLEVAGITEPTEIQAAVLPSALLNLDVIGESVTGSGKTLAYLLPIFNRINSAAKENQAIILCPTHELSVQVVSEIRKLATNSKVPVTCQAVIGETSVKRQVESLKSKPHIIVGSPGRISELIMMKKIKAHTVKTIVLDEADRLMEDSKMTDCRAIIKATQKDRQLLAFSASMGDAALSQLKPIMKDPVLIRLGTVAVVNPNIEHYYIMTELRDKAETLRRLSYALEGQRILVFMNKNEYIQDMESRLKHHKVKVCSIYGASERGDRRDAVMGFRSGKYQIMIASDVAARGLDIQDLNVVVNADIPRNSEEYLHRVGRTARYKNTGIAISLVTGKEKSFLKDVSKELKITLAEKVIGHGQILDPEELQR